VKPTLPETVAVGAPVFGTVGMDSEGGTGPKSNASPSMVNIPSALGLTTTIICQRGKD